ncbi:MAG: hypothetical protein CM15mP52_3110 [Candidatus Neomarinimicrobiota bacterium]|nr:MAG: hypothetical protein CM15mP52_3110 [Candidatus Neomarinimicrobiota bacterium]
MGWKWSDLFGGSVLEPGETIDIRIELNNDGSTDALSVSGTITCASPFVDIIDGFWHMGDSKLWRLFHEWR